MPTLILTKTIKVLDKVRKSDDSASGTIASCGRAVVLVVDALRIKDQVLEDQNQSMRTLREDVRAFETREREQETRLQALTAEHDKFIKCADVITGDLFV